MAPTASPSFGSPLPIDSADLEPTSVVTGTALLEDEEVLELQGGSDVPALSRRRFRFEARDVVAGRSTEGEHRFEGYTHLPPPYMRPDPWRPSLGLEGQRFFDQELGDEPLPVLLLIGGSPVIPGPGLRDRRATVLDGPAAGEPVRPFLLRGADRKLPEALPALVGWQPRLDAEAVERAIDADHPLIALDALRVVARPDGPERPELLEPLAERLLHPTQSPEAKVLALELLARVLARLRPRSREADSLVEITLWNWRLERRFRAETSYLETWAAAASQVRAAGVATELRAMALDETAADRLRELRARLREVLS
jgi:hypothetical protein